MHFLTNLHPGTKYQIEVSPVYDSLIGNSGVTTGTTGTDRINVMVGTKRLSVSVFESYNIIFIIPHGRHTKG